MIRYIDEHKDQFGTYAYVKTFTSINWTEPDRVAD